MAALLSSLAWDCAAVDRVALEVGQVSIPGAQVSRAAVILDVNASALRIQAASLSHSSSRTVFRDVEIDCPELLVDRPRYGCARGNLAAAGGPTDNLSLQGSGIYDSSDGSISFSGSDLRTAGADTRFSGNWHQGAWSFDLDAAGVDLPAARKLVAKWAPVAPAVELSGRLNLALRSSGRGLGNLRAHVTAQSGELNFSNEAGTTVGQKIAFKATGDVLRARGKLTSEVRLEGSQGQALAGPVLMDFAANPFDLRAHLELAGERQRPRLLTITELQLDQKDLLTGAGQALLNLDTRAVERAHLDIQRLEAAAAYRTFVQLALATTDFGALIAGGEASGEVEIVDGGIEHFSVRLQNISVADPQSRLSLANANGQIHWAADAGAPVATSRLSWSSSSAYGLIGGPVQLSFVARDMDFALIGDTRFPVFDGALVVHKLAARRVGAADAELEFDAHLEPISMPLLSKSFGWPILSGQLAGSIPGVTYRDRVLAVDGDLTAKVFDGTIVGRGLKLRDPFGPWPKLDADVSARRLDLELLTHTFPIGSITGRLDADINGLELFNWSPVAFDARLQTTPGDRSPHLISQKAVTSISNVGGGGGAVTAALQSGFLRFFDKFRYDRIGISCQLRNEVCLMSGVEPARTGYYLVKGRGLPRIDIIGNAGRVDWPQLVGQIAAGMHSQNIIVR